MFDVERFLLRLQGRRVYGDVEDQVVWTKAKMEDFMLSLFTRHWNQKDYGIFLQELFGILWCLQGCVFSAWEATWKKALTLDCIQRRGFYLANRCYLCLSEEESIDHILLHYVLAKSLWSLLFFLFGVSWVLPSSVRETLLGWLEPCVGKERKKVWFSTLLCFFWIVWKDRNSRVFENEEHSIRGCKLFFLCNLWAWN